MPDLSTLFPDAFAIMESDTSLWGKHGSINHIRYMEPAPNNRRRCRCGCKGASTMIGMANGVALSHGCERVMMRWVKEGRYVRALGGGE